MSKIAVSSPASGTATYTISAPAGSTDRTINLPDSNGTILTTATAGVPVNGPAFSAYQTSGQVLSSNVSTKITFPLLDFDATGGAYSTATSRFTPLVAGYYQVNAGVCVSAVETRIAPTIFKNGSAFKLGTTPASASSASVSALVYLNGSTDYVELYCIFTVGQAVSSANQATYFQAFLARSAT